MCRVSCYSVFVFVFILIVHDLGKGFVESAGLTFEPCAETDDCRKGLLCVDINQKLCQGQENLTDCRCRPTSHSVNICSETDLECPHGEGCAESKISNSKFCVACSVIEAPDTNYPPLHPSVCNGAPGESATPSPSPRPVRHSYDLCGIYDSCRSDLSCKSSAYPKIDCNTNHFKCQCIPKSNGSCSDSSDCVHSQEACIRDTFGNSSYCVSCNKYNSDASLIMHSSDDQEKCSNFKTLPVPLYRPLSDGLSFDNCTANGQCKEPLKCKLHDAGLSLRACEKDSAFPESCSKSSLNDCPEGEVCVVKQDISESPICVSSSTVEQWIWASQEVEILGEYPKRQKRAYGDACNASYQCREGLQCFHKGASKDVEESECLWRDGCTCESFSPYPCIKDKDCWEGEVCVNYPDASSRPFCLSSNASSEYPLVQQSESTEMTHNSSGEGWARDSCISSAHCRQEEGTRVCRHITENFGECESNRSGCICKFTERKICSYSPDCGSGEVCVVVKQSTSGDGECVSRNWLGSLEHASIYDEINFRKTGPISTPSPSPNLDDYSNYPPGGENSGDDAACIDVNLLNQIPHKDLVFSEHRRASVLCDVSGSCATPGHIVVWNKRPMRMRTYCKRAGNCSSRVRFVNSPRMIRGIRVVSRTDGLTMSALAARFDTRAEEILLTAVLRAGL